MACRGEAKKTAGAIVSSIPLSYPNEIKAKHIALQTLVQCKASKVPERLKTT
jgi:hypothetical protein